MLFCSHSSVHCISIFVFAETYFSIFCTDLSFSCTVKAMDLLHHCQTSKVLVCGTGQSLFICAKWKQDNSDYVFCSNYSDLVREGGVD